MNKEIIDLIKKNIRENTGLLKELEIYAKENNIPIIDKEASELLSILVNIKRPKKILEIGTAIAYSAILMAKAFPESKIYTIERDPKMIALAKENIRKSELNNIYLIQGDALDILEDLNYKFDLIFIDGAKGQYEKFFKLIKELTEANCLIVSDNILFRNLELNEENKRYKTIINRMKEYIKYLYSLEEYKTSILNIGDGIGLTIKERDI